MPIPYRTLSDHTLNLLAESGDTQALMELGYRAERLGILAEVRELAKRLRKEREQMNCGRCPLDARNPDHDCAAPDCLDGEPEPDIPYPSREPVCICDDGRSGHCPVHDVTW